jgi:CBS-domain-containing membrane protein
LSADAYNPSSYYRDIRIQSNTNEGVPMVMRDIMTTRVVTVEMDDRLEVVKEIFDAVNFHHLLVMDEHKTLSGIVSWRDLLRSLGAVPSP